MQPRLLGTLASVKTFTIDLGGPVYGVDHGGSGTPIVLVHGLGGSHHNWHAVAEPLTRAGHVYAIDLSGFGRTPPSGRGASVDANQRLVASFIEWLDQGPAVVMGNSMGGLVTLLLGARNPDAVTRLVLVNPASPAWDPKWVDRRWAAMSLAYMVPGLAGSVVTAYERSRTPVQRIQESFSLIAHDPDRISEDLRQVHVDMAAERRQMPWAVPAFLDAYRSIVRYLPPPRYDRVARAVTAPTLLIHGRQDRVVPFAGSRRLSTVRPDWTFAPMDGVGHVPQMEVPDVFLRTVCDWLASPTDQAR
jgi:pimeloyl-ACP methyl ester carboxylesterase